MKRVLLALGAVLAALTVVVPAAATAAATGETAKRVCVTGEVRCFAMVAVTPAGAIASARSAAAVPTGLTPAQLHRAYALPTAAPAATTVAIVDAWDYPAAYSNLTTYSKGVGLPVLPRCSTTVTTSCFQTIAMGAPPNSAIKHGWDLEIALDVEAVHAVCQNCKIVLVEAKSTSMDALAAAERTANKAASIVSNSWGSPQDGSPGAATDSAFNYPRHAIVFSSGDDGYQASYPALLKTVISVGGTTLTVAADGSYEGEQVWAGSGSGCATGDDRLMAPVGPASFQASAAGYKTAGCPAGIRGDNDVSAVADPLKGLAIYTTRKRWIKAGGTSLAAPVIAGIYALAGHVGDTTLPAATLYSHLGTSAFRDVTSGSNPGFDGCDGVPARCTARRGYDLPTGVGTPHGLAGF